MSRGFYLWDFDYIQQQKFWSLKQSPKQGVKVTQAWILESASYIASSPKSNARLHNVV